jgi:hypothetical protein
MNGWNYVESNPILYTDPTGQCKGLTGKAREACTTAKKWLQRKVNVITAKFEVVANGCQVLVTNSRLEVVTLYNSGRDRIRYQTGVDDRIDQSSPTIPYTNYQVPFSNPLEAAGLELLGEDQAYLGGDAIDLIRNDPTMVAYEQGLVAEIMSDSRYRREAFSKEWREKKDIQFGGIRYKGVPLFPDQFFHPWRPEYRPTWNVGVDQLTWLVRSTNLKGTNAQVSKGGSITINYYFEDELDFEPNRDWNTPDGAAYNVITGFLRIIWHKSLRATEMKIEANWSSSYP